MLAMRNGAAHRHDAYRVARIVTYALLAVNAALLLWSLPDYRVSIDSGYHVSLARWCGTWHCVVGSYQLRAGRTSESPGTCAAHRDRAVWKNSGRDSRRIHPRQCGTGGGAMGRRDADGAVFRATPEWRSCRDVRGRVARR